MLTPGFVPANRRSLLPVFFSSSRLPSAERTDRRGGTSQSAQRTPWMEAAAGVPPTSSHGVAHSSQVLLSGGNPQLIPARASPSALCRFGERRHGPRLMDHVLDRRWHCVLVWELQRLRGQTRLPPVSPRQVRAPLQHRHSQSPSIGPVTAEQIQTQGARQVRLQADGHVGLL